uniref:Uncharacterized protein n=1 Tax=Ciona intestinalis TaxID=7719 RepID=H2XXR5_CIOIN
MTTTPSIANGSSLGPTKRISRGIGTIANVIRIPCMEENTHTSYLVLCPYTFHLRPYFG